MGAGPQGLGASTPKRCLRQMQRGVLGAALRFLQAPAVARRKNRLSARGFIGWRVGLDHNRLPEAKNKPPACGGRFGGRLR